ncbi:thioredoxin [Marinobacter sp. R17]|uniref:thioredoxin n=1 Tax=Marinobacter sp. R17 TaxID=2484250 RepID=UPI000F4BAD3B|nr:thioredoxin [Marinobacter sp. R17]ROU01430.1 thioredoxin [Marinobacter sp. R17]
MSDVIREVSDNEFTEAVIQAKRPVLVDFWAPWCGPCHTLSPLLEELADEFAGTLDVVKVNVDQNPEITAAMGIRGVPALIVFNGGKAVAQQNGVTGLGQLRAFLAEAI